MFIAVALAVLVYGGYLLAKWPGFNPQTVAVDGNRRVSADEVRSRAAIPLQQNVWLLNKRAAELRVEAIPRVRTAQIHRFLPAAVTIVVSEREPVGCLDAHGAKYLVDETGRVIETGCAPPPSSSVPELQLGWPAIAPQQVGATLEGAERIRRLIADARVLATAKLDPARLAFDRFDGLEATLRGGPLVRFGDDQDLPEKAKLVDQILRTYRTQARDLAVIDLRSPATPVVRERARPKG